ncbi:hypothetical protein [Chryseobacterium sp. FH2]|nr:hypothetical protein [Chryseobacterium sp. FH2]
MNRTKFLSAFREELRRRMGEKDEVKQRVESNYHQKKQDIVKIINMK